MKNFHLLFVCFQLYSFYFCYSLGEESTTTTTASTTLSTNSTSTDNSTIATDTDNSTLANSIDSTATNSTSTVGLLNITEITAGNMTKSSEGHKTDLCVHEGHDASIDPQTADPGIFMSIEIFDETKSVLHIHAKEKFKGIMISTTAEGNFSVPENMPMKLMDTTGCTGVSNSDETENDHVQVIFDKAAESGDEPVFNLVLVRDHD